MTQQIYASVLMGTTGNIIPVGGGFRFLGSGDPNYLENDLGKYAYDGLNIIFEPKAPSMSVSVQDPLMVDGSFSNFRIITVTVIRAPAIVSGLSDITVGTTENTTVSITANTENGTAGSTDEYIWTVDGVEKQRGPRTKVELREQGYNISEFIIDGSTLSPGLHTITATVSTTLNSITKSDTSTANITVAAATPTFTTGLTSFSLFSNRTKTITVAADNSIIYTWSVDGIDKQTSTSTSFMIDGSTLSAGDHTLKVTATNASGSTSSQTTFVVNPVILASVAKNSQNNTIHFPAGYLILDNTASSFIDYSGSYTINSAAGTLTYSPTADLVDQIITLSLYDPTDMTGNKNAVILISILQFPVFTSGLAGLTSLRQNQTIVLSVVAESATQYAWFIDGVQKQSGASSSFSIIGSTLALGGHTIRVDASNSNGTASSIGSLTILESLPAPNAPTNISSTLESITNIKVSWASSDIVQHTFHPTDDSTFVNTTGSIVNIPIIVGIESGVQTDFYPLKPQYSTIRLRAINQNGTSSIVTFNIVMPYTIEKCSINFGGITDQYHITAFRNATPELSIIDGVTHIYDQVDTRGDQTIQSITTKITFEGAITAVGAEAFKNCKNLQSITFIGTPPVFTNFIGSVGYWNFFPDISPSKVTVNYDSSIAEWLSIVTQPNPVSPYIEFSGAPYIYENLPATATVKINTPYPLVAIVYGSPIAYQWYRNGEEIAGAKSSSYTVNESQYDTTVSYSYKSSNSRGEKLSTPIAITFVTAPIINNPLEGQSLPVLLDASSQVITMDVIGTAPITYEWSINGIALTDKDSAKLTLTGSLLTQLGDNTISFKATNAHGSVSSTATIVKVSPPVFLSDIGTVIVPTGETVIITPNIVGTQPMTYRWRTLDDVQTTPTLTLRNADYDLAGSWVAFVTVTNEYGTIENKTFIIKIEKASYNKILSVSEDYSNATMVADRVVSGTVRFSINIEGYPQQTIRWYVNNITGSTLTLGKQEQTPTNVTSNFESTFDYVIDSSPASTIEVYAEITNGESTINMERKTIRTVSFIGNQTSIGFSETNTQPFLSYTTNLETPMPITQNFIALSSLLYLDDTPSIPNDNREYVYLMDETKRNTYTSLIDIIWEYKRPSDTDYTVIDPTIANNFATITNIGNIPRIIINRSNFTPLQTDGDVCLFRVRTIPKWAYPSLGLLTTVYTVTLVRQSFRLNENGELIELLRNSADPIIRIPSSVTKIAANFIGLNSNSYNNFFINTIALHKNITFIGEGAFKNLQRLQFITGMPTNATIEKDAFANCPELEQVLFDST